MYMVRSGAVEGLEKLIASLGGNPIEIMNGMGLGQSVFRNANTYLAYHKVAELLEVSADNCAAPLFGLMMAERQTSQVVGDLSVVIATAPTLGRAIESLASNLYLHASGIHLDKQIQDERIRLALELGFSCTKGTNQLMQMSVGHLATYIASVLKTNRFKVTLHLRQNAPQMLSTMKQSQFQNIRFGASFDGVYINSYQWDAPNYVDDVALDEHLRKHLVQLQERYPNNLKRQVRDIIGRLLPTGECRIERVAAALNMHTRTLQYTLNENGESYRTILQETRQLLAEHHLQHSVMSITDLALQLGYSEVAVFSRHFKRWTGSSPRQWRKDHTQIR